MNTSYLKDMDCLQKGAGFMLEKRQHTGAKLALSCSWATGQAEGSLKNGVNKACSGFVQCHNLNLFIVPTTDPVWGECGSGTESRIRLLFHTGEAVRNSPESLPNKKA